MNDAAERERHSGKRRQLLERLEAEHALLETVLMQMPAGVIVAEAPSGRVILANERVERIWRRSLPAEGDVWDSRDLVGFRPDGRAYRPREWPLSRSLEAGEVVTDEEIEFLRGDGSRGTIEVSSAPVRDREGHVIAAVVTFDDVTERKRAERDRAQLLVGEREARAEAEAAQERLAFLADASQLLVSTLDYQATLERLARLAVARVADWCIVYMVEEDGAIRRLQVAHRDPEKEKLLRELERRFPVDPTWPHPLLTALSEGTAAILPDVSAGALEGYAHDREHVRLLRKLERRSYMVVPLIARGRILGALALTSSDARRRYGPDDLALAEDLSRRAALAVDNARLYERERSVAETLQRSLLPERLPETPGIAVAARYVAGGRGVEVGGDWYDVIQLPDGRLGLAIGDVVGRGVRAASVMGQLRNALRAYALDGEPPASVLERLDRLVEQLRSGDLATAIYAVLDPAKRSLQLARAGHPPPLLIGPDRSTTFLEGGLSVPLGVGPEDARSEHAASLSTGSTFLLYTDGLVESRRSSIEEGLAKLEQASASGPDEPEALLDHLLEAALDREEAEDDVALLAIRVVSFLSKPLSLTLPAEPSALAPMRRTLKLWLGEAGAAADEAHDILVAVSEASANAVEHAYKGRGGLFEVEASLADREVTVYVRDFGGWRARRKADRGRGLALMEALVDSLEVERTDQGTRVRLHRRLQGEAHAGP